MINDAVSSYSQSNANVAAATASADKTQTSPSETVHDTSGQSLFDTKDTVEISDEARTLSANENSAETTSSVMDDINTTQTKEQASVSTTDSRNAEGARLEEYLNELREKYGEEEAMSRFTDYMHSQGYEVSENETPTLLGGSTNKRIYGIISNTSLYERLGIPRKVSLAELKGTGDGAGYGDRSYIRTDNVHNSFIVTSNLNTTIKNGQTQYNAETWAQFDALTNTTNSKTLDFWKQRNTDELSEEAGFDISEYLANFTSSTKTWGKAFAAESTSSELASMMNTILSNAGYALESGQNIAFTLETNSSGTITGIMANTNFANDADQKNIQSAIDRALRDDPGILKAFNAENSAVRQYDVTQLDGIFDNGAQSSSYAQQRQFLLSGDEPSVMVMGSGLDYSAKGYVFTKKISDSFDATADLIELRSTSDSVSSWQNYIADKKQIVEFVSQNNGSEIRYF